jgi:hypothetical protein
MHFSIQYPILAHIKNTQDIDIVQQKLGAGSIVQWFSDRRSIYMSLSLYGYVYMSGCVCIVVFYCQMVLVGWSKWSNAERPDTPAIDSITPTLS